MGALALLAPRRAIHRLQRKMILAWLIPLEALARWLLKPRRNGLPVNPLDQDITNATPFAAPLVARFADTS